MRLQDTCHAVGNGLQGKALGSSALFWLAHRTEMIRLCVWLGLLLSVCALPREGHAQGQTSEGEWIIESLRGEEGEAIYDLQTGTAMATNGVRIRYGGAVLTAERASWRQSTGEVTADGQVRIQQGEQVWASEHIRFNFKTRQMIAREFRTGEAVVFAAGENLSGDISNKVYEAQNALLTADDVANPAIKVRAKRIKIIPGKRMEASHATVYYGSVPVFYFPYYTRNIGPNSNNLNATPGYRSLFGPFILGTYTWYINEQFDAMVHLDYRAKRGPGLGPDLNYHLGRWGDGTFRYYYTHDNDPDASELGVPIPEDRQRVYFSYQANPATNLYLKGLVQYETDLAVVRDFFESEYRRNPQPPTFFEANKFWQNFSLDAFTQVQVNEFLQTIERLPEIRLTGFRQQVGGTPFFYESETSAGYYRQRYAENTGILGPPPGLDYEDYEAGRADTYHQLLLPHTFWGWLNVSPRVGGRLTWYGDASGPGATTEQETRGVFNTGAEVSFKASRLWPGVRNKLFDVDGVRHIIEPSANYVYVPEPSTRPPQLPQFDYELPSLRLLPLEFTDYNAIDSIDSQNVIRWGLRNKLQTKRHGAVVNLVNWDIYTDWRLDPRAGQDDFADLYSDLMFRPRSWLSIESITRWDIASHQWRMSYTTITIQPSDVWSWRIGHYYLRDDLSASPTALGPGNNVFNNTMLYKLNENWGFKMAHYYDIDAGELMEQAYTVYRDLRSWTAALSFLVRNKQPGRPEDFAVAFTFSLKAFPRFPLGSDIGGPSALLGL